MTHKQLHQSKISIYIFVSFQRLHFHGQNMYKVKIDKADKIAKKSLNTHQTTCYHEATVQISPHIGLKCRSFGDFVKLYFLINVSILDWSWDCQKQNWKEIIQLTPSKVWFKFVVQNNSKSWSYSSNLTPILY